MCDKLEESLKEMVEITRKAYERTTKTATITGSGQFVDFEISKYSMRTTLEIHVKSNIVAPGGGILFNIYGKTGRSQEWLDTTGTLTIAAGTFEKANTFASNFPYIRVIASTAGLTNTFDVTLAQ